MFKSTEDDTPLLDQQVSLLVSTRCEQEISFWMMRTSTTLPLHPFLNVFWGLFSGFQGEGHKEDGEDQSGRRNPGPGSGRLFRGASASQVSIAYRVMLSPDVVERIVWNLKNTARVQCKFETKIPTPKCWVGFPKHTILQYYRRQYTLMRVLLEFLDKSASAQYSNTETSYYPWGFGNEQNTNPRTTRRMSAGVNESFSLHTALHRQQT